MTATTDIHFHPLPALHDGPATPEETREVVVRPERGAGGLAAVWAVMRHEGAQGSALPVNASWLAGRHGDEAQTAGARLLLDRLATVLGPGAHRRSRAPALTNGLLSATR